MKSTTKGSLLVQAEKGYAGARKHIGGNESEKIFYAESEQFAREKIRLHLQDLLEQELASSWGFFDDT